MYPEMACERVSALAAHHAPVIQLKLARGGVQARWLQTTRVPIRRITFQWRDRAPVAVIGSLDG